jgi:hypothetical protein
MPRVSADGGGIPVGESRSGIVAPRGLGGGVIGGEIISASTRRRSGKLLASSGRFGKIRFRGFSAIRCRVPVLSLNPPEYGGKEGGPLLNNGIEGDALDRSLQNNPN